MNTTTKQPLVKLAVLFEWVLTAILVATSVAGILVLILALSAAVSTRISENIDTTVSIPVEIPPTTIQSLQGGSVPVEFQEAVISIPVDGSEAELLVISLVGVLGVFGMTAYGTMQLRQFVRSLRKGHPFIAINAVRLRRVAWLILACWAWWGVIALLVESKVVQNFTAEGMILGDYSILRGGYLLGALAVFMIAEVFKVGVEMKEEQDLTI